MTNPPPGAAVPQDELKPGNVVCDLCEGAGFRYVSLDEYSEDMEETCPVCKGAGQITKELAEKRAADRSALAQILGSALLSARGEPK